MLRRSRSVLDPGTDASLTQTSKESAPLDSGALWGAGRRSAALVRASPISPFDPTFLPPSPPLTKRPKRSGPSGRETARESPDRFWGSRQGLIRSDTPIALGQTA